MAPVAIIPRIHCHTSAHAPYATRRQPESAWPAQDHFCKVQLAFNLNSCRISNLPRAFPLPSRSLSIYPLSIYNTYLESYEFQEEVPVQSFPSGQAVIRFNGHNPCEEYLTWQIFLCGPNYSPYRNSRGKGQEVAKVQVNVAVSKSFFWQALVHDPSTVLRALAISLEIGKPLSIELLDANTVVYQTLGSRGPKNYLVVKRS